MHGGVMIEQARTAGQQRAKLKIDTAGDWNARISYDGPHGRGEMNFSVSGR
jgi:hypothetical protein